MFSTFARFSNSTKILNAVRAKKVKKAENMCENKEISTTFPQVLKTMWKTHFSVWKTQRSFLISLISATISASSKILFSMSRCEEIMVEWSFSKIFAMLGKDISVTSRMR